MKLQVNGIEDIEITDPKGLCNRQVQQGIPIPTGAIPLGQQPRPVSIPPNLPQPMIPTPFGPSPTIPPAIGPYRPGTGDIVPPHRPPIWTRKMGDPLTGGDPKTRWGIGGPMIQQAAAEVDPEKWEKNWQGKMEPEDGSNGNGHAS